MPIAKVQSDDDSPVDLSSNKRPSNDLSQPSSSKKIKPNTDASSTYSSSVSGVKNTLHGIVFQLKLSAIFLNRALVEGYDFRIAAEMDSAEKFDDLFFEKKNPQTQLSEYRFFQVKHRLNESRKIVLADLLVEELRKNNDFSLQKYFTSFRKIKNNPEFTGNIRDLVIITNIQLDTAQLSEMGITLESVVADNFLNLKIENSNSASKCFHLKFASNHALYLRLKESADIYQLAKTLVSSMDQTLSLTNPLFKRYHRALIEEKIIDVVTKKIHNHFIDDDQLSQTAKKFRAIFLEEYSKKIRLPLTDVQPIKNKLKAINLKISQGFVADNAIRYLPSDDVMDSEINEFLSKFIFSVDNPNEEELSRLIVSELRDNRLNFIDNDLLADNIQRKMLDWLKLKGPRGQEGRFLSQREGKLFFDELKQKLDKLILIAPTLEYAAKIKKTGLKFKKLALYKFNDFLASDVQIFHLMNARQTSLTAAKLYQVVSENSFYFNKEDSYIFIRLNKALAIKDKLLNAFRASESYQLLIIDCKQAAASLEELLPELQAILSHNNRKKLIFISQESDVIARQLVLTLPSRVEVDHISFEQLEVQSQDLVLARKVSFQNRELALRDLMDAEASISVDLTDLFSYLDQPLLKIGEKLPVSKSYVEKFYVARKLQPIEFNIHAFRNKPIRDRFFVTGIDRKQMLAFVYDTQIIALEDFITDNTLPGNFVLSSESASLDLFKKFLAKVRVLEPDVGVHWLNYELEEEKGNRFIWKKTVGNLANIRSLINSQTTGGLYSESFFIHEPFNEKVIILSDIPGTGKSYFLTNLAEQFKKYEPNLWVSRINLNDCAEQLSLLNNLDKYNLIDAEKKVISFLQETLKIENNFERSFFSYSFKRPERILLLFDGFDEMSKVHQANFIHCIKILRTTQIKQIWITTRPLMQRQLEDELGCFAFNFEPFSRAEQVEVLSRIWLTDINPLEPSMVLKAKNYARSLIDRLMASTSIHSKALTSIPLTTNLLAYKFKTDFQQSIEQEVMPVGYSEKVTILDLYDHFISSTYETYCLEKANMCLESEAAKEIKAAAIETFDNQLELFAIKELFSPTIINKLNFPLDLLSSSSRLAQIGFLEVRSNKLRFIHASFTEYFASCWLYKNHNNPLLKSLVARLLKIEMSLDISLVHQFFDLKLVKGLPLHTEVVFHDSRALVNCIGMHPERGFIDSVDVIGRTALHLAAAYGYSDSVLQLLNHGANYKIRDNLLGWSAQGYAMQAQHWEAVNALLERDIASGLISEKVIDPSPHRQETLLHIAATHSYIPLARVLLENSERNFVNCVDLKGNTALHLASRYGYKEMVTLLLEKGASFSVYNFDDSTPMDYAVKAGWFEIVQILKGRGARIKSGHYQKNVPFILAVSENRIAIMRYFLVEGVNVFERDHTGNTALHYASLIGHVELIKELIPRYVREQKVNLQNNYGQTALHLGAEEGQIAIVDILLANGANPTLKASDGDTPIHCALLSKEGGNLNFMRRLLSYPLAIGMNEFGMSGSHFIHYAASEGNLAVVEFILSKWPRALTIQNDKIFSPFLLAIKNGHKEVVRFFIHKGINLLESDHFGNTAAHHAARKGHREILDLLLNKEPSLLEKRNKSYHSPLDVAVEKQKNRVVSDLIARGASVDGQGENTPLYIACEEKNIALVHMLIVAGANVNRKAWNQNTPLMGAVIAKDASLVRYLVEAGADITLVNTDGQNVMQIAEEEGESYLASYFEVKFQALGVRHGATASAKRPVAEPLNDLEELTSLRTQLALQTRKVNSDLCAGTSLRRRRHMNECTESLLDDFWYEPLLEKVSAAPAYQSHLFSMINLAVFLHHPLNFMGFDASFEHWLGYQQRIGDLIQESAENYSVRESKLLRSHYLASRLFFKRFAKATLLKEQPLATLSATEHPSIFCDNGQELVFIFYRDRSYHFYSPDIHYYHTFDSTMDISLPDLLHFVEKFFTWRRKGVPFQTFTLQETLSPEVFLALRKTPFWQPEKIISDRGLLNKAAQHLEGIPEEIIQELLRVNDKIPHVDALHPDFLLHNKGALSLRLEALHHYLSDLNQAQREALFQAMQKYNWLATPLQRDDLDEQEQSLMRDYQKKVLLELQHARSITPERLSEISWQVLHDAFAHLIETEEPGVAEKLHAHLKTTHTTFTQLKNHLKISAGQTLFFLPDIIRARNTGDPKALLSNIGFLASDMVINDMYARLVGKLSPSLSAGRARLLRKLPVTSPIFKALTAYSIFELKQQLKKLPPDSEQAQTLKHNLAEQYATVGLITAEALGFEVMPLWIFLIGEQLVFSAIHFRRDNQLDISFWEAFTMSLGFKQKKLQHIFDERNLLEENFKEFDNFRAMPFAWIIVKIAELEQARWITASMDEIPFSIQQHLIRKAAGFYGYSAKKQIIEDLGFRLTNHYKITYRQSTLVRGMVSSRILPAESQEWEKRIYNVKPADTAFSFFPIKNSYQEDNFFLEKINEKNKTYHRIVSVMRENMYLQSNSPLSIQGGLAAIYGVNQTNSNSKNLFFTFDPREGNVVLNFTREGLSALTNGQQSGNTTDSERNSPYLLTIQIKEKNYFEHLVFPENQASQLVVTDSSRLLGTSYFIDSCVLLKMLIEDNSISSRVYINPCLYNSVSRNFSRTTTTVSGDRQLLTITQNYITDRDNASFITPVEYQRLHLKGHRDYLELNLKDVFLVHNNLALCANHLKVLEIQGDDETRRFHIPSSVKLAEITTRGNLVIEDDETELRFRGLIDKDAAAIPYFRYIEGNNTLVYHLNVQDLTMLVDSLAFRNRGTLITFKHNALQCYWRNKQYSSSPITLYITGQLGEHKGYLTLEEEGCCLKVVDEQDNLLHVENTYFDYSDKIGEKSALLGIFDHEATESSSQNKTLANDYRYTPAVPGQNSSHPIFKARQFYQKEAPVFAFQAKGINVFHRFLASRRIMLNKLAYCVRDGKVFAIPDADNRLNGGQLLHAKYANTTRPVAIYINSTLDNSTINNDWRDASLTINGFKLYNLANRTQINFSDSQHYSVKLLRDSLHPFPRFSREGQIPFLNRGRRQLSFQTDFLNVNEKLLDKPQIADKANSQFSNFSVDVPGNLMLFRVFNHWFKFIKPFSTPVARQKQAMSTSTTVATNFFNIAQDFSNASSIANESKDRRLL
ncbi:MAG: ankyrin repeat domain-containing protein [Pseudomonadota bacterium]